jgi:hypothetical protein
MHACVNCRNIPGTAHLTPNTVTTAVINRVAFFYALQVLTTVEWIWGLVHM